MADQSTNVLDFAELRQRLGAVGKLPSTPFGSDLEALAVCLEYLHAEARRLREKTAGRLIGAAAECVRQEIRDQRRRSSQ